MAYPNFVSLPIAAAVAAFGLFTLVPAALAQSTGTDPANAPRVNTDEGFSSPDSGGGIFSDSTSPLDLINRAILANDRSPSDFRRQHRNQISTEADNFRTLQQDALRRQQSQSGAPDTIDAIPSDNNVIAPETGE